MSEPRTAKQESLTLDIKRNRANQYATMMVHELLYGGYIAPRVASECTHHLANLFYRHDVEITTAEQRELSRVMDAS